MSKVNEDVNIQDQDDDIVIAKTNEEPEESIVEEAPIEEVLPKKEYVSNASIDNDKFDWDAYEQEKGASDTDKEQTESEYAQTLSKIIENDVVEGTVVAINKREVIVNIGYKSEGVINISEFRYNPELAVGDKVEVYVENAEDRKGQLLLSHKKARAIRAWDRVNHALETGEIIKGYIKCRTKGGMIVDVFGIEAFLPGSQIDVKPIRDYETFVNKTMEFKIVKINQEFKNIVVSHKALIEAELEVQKLEIISRLEKGQVLEGTVKNILNYGVFIDLGGVDGLIHITDLSWGRVNHPDEIVKLDQKLNVVILDFDDEKKRIALGLKQLTPHPWDSLESSLVIGGTIKGRVVVIADYGAFIEVMPGVEGLIHVSEMSWSQHLRSAQDFMKVDDEVEAVILTLDRAERKMSLGIKQLKPDPWMHIISRYAIGSRHSAKVRNFTNFGVFVELEEGIDGLVHISDLSWTKKVKHPAEFTSIGDTLEVVVLEVDQENRRLSLGHKQLEENPWDVFETIFTYDSVHEGTVMSIADRSASIALPYGVEGIASIKNLLKEDGKTAKVDDRLLFKVIEFSKGAKRITVSHTRAYEDAKRETETKERTSNAIKTQKAVKKLHENLEKTTLGDISELAALRSEMEEQSLAKAPKKAKPAAVAPPAEPVEAVTEPVEAAVEPIVPAVEPVETLTEAVETLTEAVETPTEAVEAPTETPAAENEQ
ncbi:MAG: 30S ribosomal protein S1 [Prevotellaceae bacterium]|jgi:small subunit ribosomal protein S1|nr:30S ribosomal protein S1 [Prevotellaceae bacterium]